MSTYTCLIPADGFDGLFYRAILNIMQNRGDEVATFSQAQVYIEKARDLLSTELSALASESYSR